MGTGSTKHLAVSNEVFMNSLEAVSAESAFSKEPNWPLDIIAIVISYSTRREQFALINLVFSDIQAHEKELSRLSTVLSKQNSIRLLMDTYLISSFNQSNGVLSSIGYHTTSGFKFFFTNLVLAGTPKNTKYLIENHMNCIYAFIYYISVKKQDILKRDNERCELSIDAFVDSFRASKLNVGTQLNPKDTFHSEEEKLESISYVNAYEFDRFERTKYAKQISWRDFNNTFLQYLLTNQFNFCVDDNKLHSKRIRKDMDVSTLDALCGCSFYGFDAGLVGYCINSRVSKHTAFLGAINKVHIRSKKVNVSTKKTSSVFLFPAAVPAEVSMQNEKVDVVKTVVNVMTMVNSLSEHHIQPKQKIGKKIENMWTYTFVGIY